ncbi:endoplasmic reticulum-Golgi intermediate compartment protein 3-like [Ascaphus truei]|uniref:endoplasmic reticulum-Golgi intermediate compartment protein 3-like n=1 Tax=Ascaphus truei TaxID=8439 RepID=UPI003F59541B
MEEQRNEGYQVYGFLEVNKVAGNFHFAPEKSFQQSHVHVHAVEIHDLQSFGLDNVSMIRNSIIRPGLANSSLQGPPTG